MKTNSIKMWSVADRPREKLLDKGRRELSDAELLAILIGSGTNNLSALDLTKTILGYCNHSLIQLGNCEFEELIQFPGIGEAKALSIIAALELARRRSDENPLKRQKITCSKDAYLLLKQRVLDIYHEEFYAVFMNRSNEVIKISRISSGGISGTAVDAKIIFKEAIVNKSSGMIVAHNHPSGQLKPSNSDKILTNKLREFGQLIDLPVLDHLILSDNGYFSFADEGML